MPYSRYNPQFKKDALAASLKDADIAYVYLGRELGAHVQESAFPISNTSAPTARSRRTGRLSGGF